MHNVSDLVGGYRAFRRGLYRRDQALYRSMARQGQAPSAMVVACCDSRVDPVTVFSAKPGELFIVRNVANLVPPFEPDGDYHGTSAAVEYAVTGLKVDHIVVLGHAGCGGIRAFLEGLFEPNPQDLFIGKWMSLMNTARAEAIRTAPAPTVEARQTTLEHIAIRYSIANLTTFPFVRQAIDGGTLQVHGAYFNIANGELSALDTNNGEFQPISTED